MALGGAKLEVVRSSLWTGALGKAVRKQTRKQSKKILWENLVDCLWLVSLKFHFLHINAFIGIDSGLNDSVCLHGLPRH